MGTGSSALLYDIETADLTTITNEDDKSVGDWSFVPFGNWMLAAHNGKLWIWKPFDDNERICSQTAQLPKNLTQPIGPTRHFKSNRFP